VTTSREPVAGIEAKEGTVMMAAPAIGVVGESLEFGASDPGDCVISSEAIDDFPVGSESWVFDSGDVCP